MLRRSASAANKDLALLFASVVTTPVPAVNPKSQTLAKTGDASLFEMFTWCFRRCVRDNSRDGLSASELHQMLEINGFKVVRFRKRQGHSSHDQSQNIFRYGARRWRDPDNIHDMAYLRDAWPQVNMKAPVACLLEVVVQQLRAAVRESLSQTEMELASCTVSPKHNLTVAASPWITCVDLGPSSCSAAASESEVGGLWLPHPESRYERQASDIESVVEEIEENGLTRGEIEHFVQASNPIADEEWAVHFPQAGCCLGSDQPGQDVKAGSSFGGPDSESFAELQDT